MYLNVKVLDTTTDQPLHFLRREEGLLSILHLHECLIQARQILLEWERSLALPPEQILKLRHRARSMPLIMSFSNILMFSEQQGSRPFVVVIHLFKPGLTFSLRHQILEQILYFPIVVTELARLERRCPQSTNSILIRSALWIHAVRTNHIVRKWHTSLTNPEVETICHIFLDSILIVVRSKSIRVIKLEIGRLLSTFCINLHDKFINEGCRQLTEVTSGSLMSFMRAKWAIVFNVLVLAIPNW